MQKPERMAGSSAKKAFNLFVYGTLKKGFDNHDRFLGGVSRIQEATTRGRLYDLPFGFPALVVEPSRIFATGTSDPDHDAFLQLMAKDEHPTPTPEEPIVYGELATFDDAQIRLPNLDHLEGFDPGGQSLYRRVLIPVETESLALLAWAYAIEKSIGTHLPGGRWPS